ncbi:hypothetical protein AB0K93_13910 [Streptomyces sp. NPDC052676]|uniref:hypothetical protein n=1 Tax=Streptomyces sp. NPDC052676 TaxID=3154953 RepID=UPI00341B1E2C
MTPTATAGQDPRTRRSTRAAIVLGVVCGLVAAWLLLVPMRGALDDERAFRAAVACGADGARDGDCLWTVTARIERVEVDRGRRSHSYWLYLREADGTSSRTRLNDSPPAGAGQRVEVTYWRDRIRYVDFPTERRPTTADPRDDHRVYTAWALGIGLYGLGILAVVTWWSRRPRTTPRAHSWQLGWPLLGAFALAGLGVVAALSTDGPGEAFLTVAAGLPVITALSWAGVRLAARRERGDDTVDVIPSVPDRERVVLGEILGEVPYARGGGHLVAGPGLLASTPDPTGGFRRREAPPTLTPLRVRPPYHTDPALPEYGGRALVLECDDNGTQVLIVTHRKDMPWILGALDHTAARP